MAWGLVIGAVLSGLSSSSKAKQKKEINYDRTKEGMRDAAKYQREQSLYETQLADWMRQADKQRSRDALSNFTQYSSLQGYQPNYTPERVSNAPPGAGQGGLLGNSLGGYNRNQ